MDHIHINRGTNRRYVAMVRRYGHRMWERAGPDRRSKNTAIDDLAGAFKTGDWKRGVILFTSDYYDPQPILHMNK